ncbi:hypothetical protein HYH03_010262 [Edaphochlamys debaryana]|uniref:Uncharacterized protein n=1 Tax=Edaphochlamys debaryana TaxID=47281 RepID=A0A835XUM9_9CHLO|nr:hypothetical protein HYH03_010262 [Edaphochlamys debaryana]|eukprot:KAG2491477.1 hypothetical protein HYH03_010262 [Edaphochlamys debaryana]
MTRAPASFAPGSLMFAVEVDLEGPRQAASCQAQAGRRRKGASNPGEVDLALRTLAPSSGCASKRLLDDVRTLKRQGCATDAAALAEGLRALGYDAVRLAQHASHGGPSSASSGSSGLRLAHDFVVVAGCGSSPQLIVEPNFREHFGIGSIYATDRYKQVLAAIPEELVAPYSQLEEMVKLICEEMKFSFEATGNYLPPWRSTASVLSRWSPIRGSS